MSLCALCRFALSGDDDLCPHHHTSPPDDWAQANRLMCDFLHRKFIPAAVEEPEAVNDLWTEGDGGAEEPTATPEVLA